MIGAGGALDLLVRSSLVLAMIWIAAAALGRAGGSAAMRHTIWLLGLGALILLPLLSALMPPLELAVLPASPAEPLQAAMPAAAMIASAAPGPAAAAPVASLGLGDLLQLLYLAIAAGLLGRLAIGRLLLARLWQRARPVRDARWTNLLAELAATLAIRVPVAIRIAAGPAMPMTWGTLRPRILLPAEAPAWTDERLRIVLLHELAHIARRDSFARSAATIVCALYWAHPAIWYAARRMRLEQEHACDDLVLSLGAKASIYARSLIEVAGAFRPIAPGLSVAMVRTSELERRVTAIVGRGPRSRASARFVAGTCAGAVLATLLIATIAPVAALQSTPAPMPAPPAADFGPASPPAPAAPATPSLAAIPEGRSAPAPVRPVPAPAMFAARAAVPTEADYERAAERHAVDLEAYDRQLADYRRQLDIHRRQVSDLRDQGNLANTGNTGNSGNSGNSGNPGMPARPGQPAIPPTMPTPPTAPTPPTPPSALSRPAQLVQPTQPTQPVPPARGP